MSEQRLLGEDEKYCSECGEIIRSKAEICPKCGVRQILKNGIKEKSTIEIKEYSYNTKSLWWIISLGMVVVAFGLGFIPGNKLPGHLGTSGNLFLFIFLMLLLTAIMVNPILHKSLSKIKLFQRPFLRLLPGMLIVIITISISMVIKSSDNKKEELLKEKVYIVSQTESSIKSEYSKKGLYAYSLMGDWKTDKDWEGAIKIKTSFGEIVKDVNIRVKDDGSFIWKVK
jgi:hypothetical protein